MLKFGTNIYASGLRFEYSTKSCVPHVAVYDAEQTHNLITRFNVELLVSVQDLEVQAAWWVYDNNVGQMA